MTDPKPSVLFVCTGNAGRSQMAHALFRQRAGDRVRIESAGVEPWSHLHPVMVKLMTERGVPLEGHFPKPVGAVADRAFDLVVTIGDPARARLPKAAFSASYWIHWDISDPADADHTPDSEGVFRRTAAAIEERLPDLEEKLPGLPGLSAFALRPGIGTGLWGSERFVPSLHLPPIKQAGFAAIELNLYRGRDHFDWEDRAAVGELRRVADDLDLVVWSIHSPDLGNAAAADAGERQRQIDVLRQCLDLAEVLGSRAIPSHALLVDLFGEAPPESDHLLAEFLEALQAPAEASIAQIAFENGGLGKSTSSDLFRHLDQASRAAYGFVLDTGHANLDGDLENIRTGVGDHLISLHLNDNHGTGDHHLPPGEGSVDWNKVGQLLEESGYGGVIMYEVGAGDRDPRAQLEATMAAHCRLFAPGEGK